MKKYVINQEACTKCGICASVCVVYEKKNNEVRSVHESLCIDCGHCESICPKQAIRGPHEINKITELEKMSMPTSEELLLLLKTRRSVRRYRATEITDEHLDLILKAGQYAPTGSNAQDVQYIIINDLVKMQELRAYLLPKMYKLFNMATKIASLPFAHKILGKNQAHKLKNVYGEAMKLFEQKNEAGEDRLFYHAPALMIVHGEKQDEAAAFSSHIAMHQCTLMAQTLGIGCLLNSFALMTINSDQKLKERFGIPKDNKCFGVMCFGYMAIDYQKHVYREEPKVTYL